MKIEALLRMQEQLLGDEGFRSAAYQDSMGFWTIGVGRLIDARKGGGISPEEALFLLGNDIAAKERELDARIPWWRQETEVRQRVMLDLAFNLGVAGLLNFRITLQSWKEGRYEEAADELESSQPWASQVGRRANRLAEMLRTGKDA